jgi:hypothetical protein
MPCKNSLNNFGEKPGRSDRREQLAQSQIKKEVQMKTENWRNSSFFRDL